MVVPLLPPTGVAGVGSLNPSPGPSRLSSRIVTAPATETIDACAPAQASTTAKAVLPALPRRSLMGRCRGAHALVRRRPRTTGMPGHGSAKAAAQVDLHSPRRRRDRLRGEGSGRIRAFRRSRGFAREGRRQTAHRPGRFRGRGTFASMRPTGSPARRRPLLRARPAGGQGQAPHSTALERSSGQPRGTTGLLLFPSSDFTRRLC